MVDEFIARRHDRRLIEYLTPGLAPILGETYGLLLYQEQVELIATMIGGYSPAESDLMRRTLCRQKPLEIGEEKTRFLAGASANGIAPTVAEAIFALINEYAGFSFNKAHAVAYCMISYWSAWLKTYYGECFTNAWKT
jgi:DNA polymerase-3 subunit alpha